MPSISPWFSPLSDLIISGCMDGLQPTRSHGAGAGGGFQQPTPNTEVKTWINEFRSWFISIHLWITKHIILWDTCSHVWQYHTCQKEFARGLFLLSVRLSQIDYKMMGNDEIWLNTYGTMTKWLNTSSTAWISWQFHLRFWTRHAIPCRTAHLIVFCLQHHHINFCTRVSINLPTGFEIIGFYMTPIFLWFLFKCTILTIFHHATPFNTYKSMQGNCCFFMISRVSSRSCRLWKQLNGFGQVSHLHSTSCTAQWRFKSLEFQELMGLSLAMVLVSVLGCTCTESRTVRKFDHSNGNNKVKKVDESHVSPHLIPWFYTHPNNYRLKPIVAKPVLMFQTLQAIALFKKNSSPPCGIHQNISLNAFCTPFQWFAQALCRCCTFCESFALASSLRRTSQLRVVIDSLEGCHKMISDLLGKVQVP